jgi:hypothetical protein
LQIDEHNLNITAELPKQLPARTARRCEYVSICGYGYTPEPPCAFGHSLEYGDPFRAHRQPVCRVLDIAARVDDARYIFKRRAYLKIREDGVRMLASPERSIQEN